MRLVLAILLVGCTLEYFPAVFDNNPSLFIPIMFGIVLCAMQDLAEFSRK